jgi:Lar family restriction alleviation protein
MTDKEKLENDLKPCPFCGGKATLLGVVDEIRGGKHFVSCFNRSCKVTVETEFCETEKKAIAAWNKRKEV